VLERLLDSARESRKEGDPVLDLLEQAAQRVRKSMPAQADATKESAAAAKPKKPREREADLADAGRYERLPYGAEGCPPGLEIRSVEDCERAILSLGLVASPQWVSAYPGLPSGCSIRERPEAGSAERMHFNSAAGGAARSDLAPICLRPQTDEEDPSSLGSAVRTGLSDGSATDAAKAKAQMNRPPKTPELTGQTQGWLMGNGIHCFVYLKEGHLSGAEDDVLQKLKAQFDEKTQAMGLVLKFAWMNVQVERKLREMFDPPALPSAVLVDVTGDDSNGHKPRYALMAHEEQDGDFVPASLSKVESFLDAVLDGDGEFTEFTAKKLSMSWAKRKQ